LSEEGYSHTVWIFPSETDADHTFQKHRSTFQEELHHSLTDTAREPWRVTETEADWITPSCTGHPDVIGIARAWLKTCERDHPFCGLRFIPWWPKRLLDLTGSLPRLMLTERETPRGNYATLSHCWGENPTFITLTAENIERLQNGCLPAELPQSFLDAIEVTRGLGIQYLWIDSLCIIQSGEGSLEDWTEHVDSMTDVYWNCTINISINRAKNANEGCFVDRNSLLAQECQINWHGFHHDNLKYTVCSWNTSGYGALDTLPIAKRAWVVQERLLAPRVLHFGSEQIFWDCNIVTLASETVPLGLPLHVTDYYGRRAFTTGPPRDRLSRTLNGHTTSPSRSWEPWLSIVKQYTSCSLTYPDKDKFKALAGVAEHEARSRSDSYVAGFFRADLLWDITWSVHMHDHALTKRAQNQYRAPTWSWACMDGPVGFQGRLAGPPTLIAKLRAVNLIPVERSSNPFSGAQHGTLKIESFLIPATCKKVTTSHGRSSVEMTDAPVDSVGYLEPHWSLSLYLDDFDLLDQDKTRIDLLRIESRPRNQESGLILRWNEINQSYNRIGMFISTSPSTDRLRSCSVTLKVVEID
jgi:hypothetical protein